MTEKRPLIVAIDGNIGCGKSTVMHWLSRNWQVATSPEPVHEWHSLLLDAYSKAPGGSFALQTKVWYDRCLCQPPSTGPERVVFVERSPLFQRCFLQTNQQSMSPAQYEFICSLYDKHQWEPDLYIYVYCEPARCMQRIAHRLRAGESLIPESYIQAIHDHHEQGYMFLKGSGRPHARVDSTNLTPGALALEIMHCVRGCMIGESFQQLVRVGRGIWKGDIEAKSDESAGEEESAAAKEEEEEEEDRGKSSV